MLGFDVVIYLVEVFGCDLFSFRFEDAFEIVAIEPSGDVVLLGEAVEHLLIPFGEVAGAVIGEGETDFLFFGETSATYGDDLLAIGFDDADVFDASGFGPFDGAVASEDAVVFVDDDAAGCAVAVD